MYKIWKEETSNLMPVNKINDYIVYVLLYQTVLN